VDLFLVSTAFLEAISCFMLSVVCWDVCLSDQVIIIINQTQHVVHCYGVTLITY